MKISISRLKLLFITVITLHLTGCFTNVNPKHEEIPNNQEAVHPLKNSDQLKVNSVDEALTKARSAWNTGKKDLALAYYISAFNLDPKNINILSEMAVIYNKLGNQKLETVCYRMILDLDPNQTAIQQRYGLLLLEQKKLGEAQQALSKVILKDEKNWQSYNGLGIIYDIKGKHKIAQKYLKKSNCISPFP